MFYSEYIQAPLQNLLLWLTGIVPGHSLVLGLLLMAIITKLILFVFIYHGHIHVLKSHHIKKHAAKLATTHKNDHQKLAEELELLYDHYEFSPIRAFLISLIQFIILFTILNFLYTGAPKGFNDISLTTMDNIFRPMAMNINFGSINLALKITSVWALIALGFVQFFSLELYLLVKRKLHRHETREEIIEHIVNLIIAITVVFVSSQLPAALAFYWFFYICLGIIRRLFFDYHLDKNIVKKLSKMERNFINKEEPVIKKADETLIFFLWKIFHLKTPEKNYHELRSKIRRKFLKVHHHYNLINAHHKILEEPHVAAFLLLFL